MVYNPDDDFPFDEGPPQPPDPPDAADYRREGGAGPRPRKERVLHTRVSEQLSEDIRRAADDLRVPVSNLVRNVLEEAFGAVERVSDEVGGFLEEVLGETQSARDDLRRLRRRVKHLARRQRRRFARRSEERWDEEEAPADDLDPAEEPQPDRLETFESEVPPAPRPPEPPAFPDVIGWQPLLANAAARCAACGRRLEPGERVFAGATERGLSRTLLCAPCLRSRTGA
jgi:hypothetical protein